MKGSDETVKKILVWCLLLVLLCGMVLPGQAELMKSKHPLIDPQEVTYVETEDEFYNVLLCGIDFGRDLKLWTSGYKHKIEVCHTDVVMLASINKTKGTLNLVSIPRDSVTYVPGIHGIYKLNAAFNCAEDMEAGMQNVCRAVSWHLGGIPVHNYLAVDLTALVALGDAIGGVYFEVDMNYWGSDQKRVYRKGMQHLDGWGIMDYVRARKNATKEANDVGRTRRGRDMMIAIFDKVQQLIGEEGLSSVMLKMVNILFGGEYNVLTDLTRADLLNAATMLTSVKGGENIGSYVLDGRYSRSFEHWNFTFNDQDHRKTVLKEAFGLDAEPIPYVLRSDATWLINRGFAGAKHLRMAQEIYRNCAAVENPTKEQQETLANLEEKYNVAVQAFDFAADDRQAAANNAMDDACKQVRKAAEKVVEAFDYQGQVNWYSFNLWYQDPRINEYNKIDWD